MVPAARNQIGLSAREIEHCLDAWKVLCGEQEIELVIGKASSYASLTYFNESDGKVYLGANAKPGNAVDVNSRMSILACLAHELAHAERFELEFRRPFALPDKLIDESETSLHASFHPVLNSKDREDLIEDARDRLINWLAEKQIEAEK
jgi:hypothetical protein